MAASAVRELIVRIAYALNKSSQRKADSSINATKKNMNRMAESAESAGMSASRSLGRISGSAARAAAAVSALTGRFSALRSRMNGIGGRISMPGLGGLSNIRFTNVSAGLTDMRNRAIAARRAVGMLTGAVGALTVALNPLALAFAGAFSIYAIKNAADEMMNLDGRLRTLYEDEQERLAIEDRLYMMSQRNRQGLNEIGDLYFKVASSVEQ